MLRVAVRAPLAHAEPVAPAVAGEAEDGDAALTTVVVAGAVVVAAVVVADVRGRGRRETAASGRRGRAGATAAERTGEATHADHGSRGFRGFPAGFTERFHSATDGNRLRCPTSGMPASTDTPSRRATTTPARRPRRHGRDLPRDRRGARPRGGGQGARRRATPRTPLRERFRREALAAARLSGNRNIVTIFDVDEHDGRPMIVMEYSPAARSSERLARVARAAGAGARLARGRGGGARRRARRRGRPPRREAGEPAARRRAATSTSPTSGSRARRGSTRSRRRGRSSAPRATSRRSRRAASGATAASDRYALAVVAWELLAGTRPFEPTRRRPRRPRTSTTPVPSLHAANPSLPRSLDAVFDRALAKDPRARYPSAAEFVGDLRRALHDEQRRDLDRTRRAPRDAAAPASAPRAPRSVDRRCSAVAARRRRPRRGPRARGCRPAHDRRPTTVVRTVTSHGTTVHADGHRRSSDDHAPTTTADPTAPARAARS